MHFIYAVENVRTLSDDKLAKMGLGHLGTSTKQRPFDGPGPGGVRCLLVATAETPIKQMAYAPAAQTWERSVNEAFWIGIWTESPPTEVSLRRDPQVDGHRVKLGDGGDWLIPCARCYGGGSKLPQSLKRTTDGLMAVPIPQYAAFCQRAERLWDYQLSIANGTEPDEWDYSDQWDLCAEALSINYRIGPDEANLLGLMTTQNLHDIGSAIVDMPTVAALLDEKKKAAAAENG